MAENTSEDHLEALRRIVWEAEAQITKQSELIEQLRAEAQNTKQAEELLRLLENLLRLARKHLSLVEGAARTHGKNG